MLSLALLALAAGILAWPAAGGCQRLPGLAVNRRSSRDPRPADWYLAARPVPPVAVLSAGLLGSVLIGPGGALAAAMITGTAVARRRSRRRRCRGAAQVGGLVDAVGLLVAELRAGAHPASAIDVAAAEATADVAPVLGAAASAARLGADVPEVLRRHDEPTLRPWLVRLADAWALAQRHGVPLAGLIDAVRCDAEQRIRFAADLDARLAGPRASAAVLAGLPVLGLMLGQAIGADPWQVLAGTTAGQLLLVLGAALACAGVVWSGRIVTSAVPS